MIKKEKGKGKKRGKEKRREKSKEKEIEKIERKVKVVVEVIIKNQKDITTLLMTETDVNAVKTERKKVEDLEAIVKINLPNFLNLLVKLIILIIKKLLLLLLNKINFLL